MCAARPTATLMNDVIRLQDLFHIELFNLITSFLELRDLEKMPCLCKTTRGALDWRQVQENRTVRFPLGVQRFLVRGNGFVASMDKADVSRKKAHSGTLISWSRSNGFPFRHKIFLSHGKWRRVEYFRYDSNLRHHSRIVYATDLYEPDRHDAMIKAVNECLMDWL